MSRISEGQITSASINNVRPRRRNKNHTVVLFIIVMVFIFCHSLRCIYEFYDGIYEPFEIKVMQMVSRLLLIVHSSANPFIYMIKIRKFRKHLYGFVIRIFTVSNSEDSAVPR